MFALFCLLAAGSGASVQGAILFNVTGPVTSNTGLGETNLNTAQGAAGEEFTLATTFTNVSFSMTLVGGGIPLTAWLTDKIGNGTNKNDVIATSTASPGAGVYTPFSGLTLAAWTYFLVFAAVQQPNSVGWDWTGSPTISQAPGVTFVGAFENPGNTNDSWNNPAYTYKDFTAPSTNDPFFGELDGTAAPEPGSLVLAGAGLVLVLFLRMTFSIRAPKTHACDPVPPQALP
jgi:hypothetical protein